MKKYKYFISIFCMIGVAYYFIQDKSGYSYHKEDTQKKNLVSKEKEQNPHKDQQNNIEKKEFSLDKILNTKIKEPEATKVWEWLQKNGFNHPQTLEMLNELSFARGAIKYHKELIGIIKSRRVSDEIASEIILILGGAYSGKGENNNDEMYVAKDEKDKAIQDFILNQVESPMGAKSLYSALDILSYAKDKKEVQTTLDNLIQNKQSLLPDTELYKLKVSHSIFGDDIYSQSSTLEQITTLSESKQKELIPTIIDSFDRIMYSDNEIKQKINNLLERNPPSSPKILDEELIEKEFDKNFKVPDNITNLDDVMEYGKSEHQKFYEESREKINESIEAYGKWVKAYADTSQIDNKYDFYKNKILKVEKIEEKCAILTMISNESTDEPEYDEYLEKLYSDYDMKEVIEQSKEFWKSH